MTKKIIDKQLHFKKHYRPIYYIANVFLTAIILGGIMHIVIATYTYFMPYTHWFEYEAITSVKQEYKVKEKPTFISDSDIYKIVDMRWVDILHCDYMDGIGYRMYRSLTQDYTMIPVGITKEPWVFNIEGPSKPAECFLKTFATISLPYGIKKTQEVDSNKFYFVK